MPGEVTAEEANAIGYELAMRFTKGKRKAICGKACLFAKGSLYDGAAERE